MISGRTFNKEIETIKKNWSELKNTITKMKNTTEGMNSKPENTEKCISELGDRLVEGKQGEEQREKRNF